MNLNKFTQKAQEAVMRAQGLAEENNHSQIEPVHLLASLLQQDEGVVPQIVKRIGVNLASLQQQVQERLSAIGERGGLIVLFDRIERDYLPDAEHLLESYPLEVERRFADGIILRVAE